MGSWGRSHCFLLKLNGFEMNSQLRANASGREAAVAGINWTYVAIGAAVVVGGVVYNNVIKEDETAPSQ